MPNFISVITIYISFIKYRNTCLRSTYYTIYLLKSEDMLKSAEVGIRTIIVYHRE